MDRTGVAELIRDRFTQLPDAAGFIDAGSGRRLTWRDLGAAAQSWAGLARERRLTPGSRVCLAVADPLPFTAAYLGCLAAGLTAVPVDPRRRPPEIALSAERLRARVLVTADGVAADGAFDAWRAGDLGPTLLRRWSGATRETGLTPAVLLTTSGTTAAAKGVPLSLRSLLAAARQVATHHRLGPGDRGYSVLPLFHVNAQVVGLLATLVSSGSLVLDDGFSSADYWARVEAWRPTWLNTVPAILASLAGERAPGDDVRERVRFARSASAPLAPGVLRDFHTRTGIDVLETYGMTEAAGQITANPLRAQARRDGSVGLPVATQLEVRTPSGARAAPGETGVVAVRGPSVTRRYLELRSTGAERVHPARDHRGWLTTGDLGFVDDEGFLHLRGRDDDVINRGGEKLDPVELERVLLGHTAVEAAAVVAAPHARLGEVPVAFVTSRAGDAARLVAELRAACDARLPRQRRPVRISVVPRLPLGPTGKLLRRQLRATVAA